MLAAGLLVGWFAGQLVCWFARSLASWPAGLLVCSLLVWSLANRINFYFCWSAGLLVGKYTLENLACIEKLIENTLDMLPNVVKRYIFRKTETRKLKYVR